MRICSYPPSCSKCAYGGGVAITALVGFVGVHFDRDNDGLYRTIGHHVDHSLKPEPHLLCDDKNYYE